MLGFAGATGAAAATAPAQPLRYPDAQLEPLAWTDLDGWAADDHAAAFAAFRASCRPITRDAKAAHDARPIYAALHRVCRKALAGPALDADKARAFFEDNFRPSRIARLGDAAGFLTGYYEPIVDGSRVQTPEFTAPLYRRPWNLVYSGRSRSPTPESFPNKGVKVGRLVGRRKLVPFYDRLDIENGALAGRNLEICWLKSSVDVFFAQIQGSVRVRLDDGTMLRLNYDSHNGYGYTPVGRLLIDRGIVPKEEMSMDRIRQWMDANPDQAKELRGKNQSYVFFRVTNLSAQEEPLGAQGVSLTPGRSIAVDRSLHSYGTPFFIEADLPIATADASTKFRRLMVAQDTGSAIVGPARADIYFGAGEDAARIAGRIRQPGKFAILIPRDLDAVAGAEKLPLPPPRPDVEKIQQAEAAAAEAAAAATAAATAKKPAVVRRTANRYRPWRHARRWR